MVEETPSKGVSSRTIWIRSIVFVTIAGWLALTPAARTLFGPISSPLVLRWTMFHSFGSDICQVRYFKPLKVAGRFGEINWRKVLRPDGTWVDHRNMRIRSVADAEMYGRRLCAKTELEDIRARISCGSVDGWNKVGSFQTNYCALATQGRERGTP